MRIFHCSREFVRSAWRKARGASWLGRYCDRVTSWRAINRVFIHEKHTTTTTTRARSTRFYLVFFIDSRARVKLPWRETRDNCIRRCVTARLCARIGEFEFNKLRKLALTLARGIYFFQKSSQPTHWFIVRRIELKISTRSIFPPVNPFSFNPKASCERFYGSHIDQGDLSQPEILHVHRINLAREKSEKKKEEKSPPFPSQLSFLPLVKYKHASEASDLIDVITRCKRGTFF